MHQTEITEAYESCTLCPHKCRVNRCVGHLGKCMATSDCIINHIQLHYWEEPTLTLNDVQENVGSGTVFFGGCPLLCIYCQNWKISSKCKGRTYSSSEIADVFLDLQNQGALNINIVTGTHYTPSITSAIEVARSKGLTLPIVWNTSGYENVDTIKTLIPYIDTWLFDFKYYNDELAISLSGAKDYLEIATLALNTIVDSKKYNQDNIIVRHLVLPGHTDDSKSVLQHLYYNYCNRIKYSIMGQYSPAIKKRASLDKRIATKLKRFPELGMPLARDEYEEVLNFADEIGIEDYFWQESGADSESFIPDFE